MGRVRIAFGLLIVIVGTVWLLGGASAIRTGARWAPSVLPYVVLALGVLLLLRAAVPRGLLAAPVVLLVGGSLWVAYDNGYLGGSANRILPGIVIVLGAVIALGATGREADGARDDGPLRRYRSVLLRVRPELGEVSPPLRRISAGSYLGEVRLDLHGVPFVDDPYLKQDDGGATQVLVLDVTVLFGSVVVRIDHQCAVVKGNVANAMAVHFADQVRVYATTDVYRAHAASSGMPRRVLLNVLGVGGTVDIRSL